MMIDPEGFIYFRKNDSNEELLSCRDELIEEIRLFEMGKISEEDRMTKPSPAVKYQFNLLYLAKVCELISERYREGNNFLTCHELKYRYCLVKPKGIYKSYSYIAEEELGDISSESFVLVPFGKENKIVKGRVMGVMYCSEETAPYPVKLTKKIIKLISFEEYCEDEEDKNRKNDSDEANTIKCLLKEFLSTYNGKSPVYTGFTNNKPELEIAKSCGCFYCEQIFNPKEIEEWIYESRVDHLGTAICPHCGNDTVIGELTGLPINKDYLHELHVNRFG